MIKKLSFLLIFVLLLAQLGIPAIAAPQASLSVVSAYCQNDTFYTFIQPDSKEDLSAIEISLKGDGPMSRAQAPAVQVADSDSTVEYLLLVDLSTSMYYYRDKVLNLADALVKAEKRDIRVTVAGFGERFEVIEENLLGFSKVREVLENLPYRHEATDICNGLTGAMEYLSGRKREDGWLVNLVLLSDGVPYLEGSPAENEKTLKESAEKATEMIAETPEVIVHTVGFEKWDPVVIKAVSSGSGVDLMATSWGSESKAGEQIAQFADDLYRLDFPFTWGNNPERIDVRLFLSFSDSSNVEIVPVNFVRNLTATAAASVPGPSSGEPPKNPTGGTSVTPTPSPTASSMPEEPSPSPESSSEGSSEEPSSETSSSEASSQVSSQAAPVTSPTPTVSGVDKQDDESDEQPFPILYIGIIGAAVLIILLLCVLLAKKRRAKSSPTVPEKVSGPEITMKAEVLSGQCKNHGAQLVLRDQLIFGSGESCDLVFEDSTVAPKNTRIFLMESIVYIEDISGQGNTYLGGMKLYSPNRLRSGDEISMGNVNLRLRF